jgi:hypothetical protein
MRLKSYPIILGTLLFLTFTTIFLIGHRSQAVADKIFGNMAYLTNSPYFSEEVTLTGGRYDWNYSSEDDVFVFYHLQYEGRYVYGDFNHDGLKDVAVIMAESSGGTAEWYSVVFLINDGKKLVHRTSGLLGDRAIINSLRQNNGKVVADMFIHQDGDCMAGPTNHVKSIFEYSEGKRWIEGVQISAKSFFDPILYVLRNPSSWAYVFERWKAS